MTDDNVDLLAGIKETSVLLLFGYISFAFAEAVGKSGIVASLICGITMAQYTRRVQSRDGKVTSTAVFKMLSSLADTAIFFQVRHDAVAAQRAACGPALVSTHPPCVYACLCGCCRLA
ncbi:hypothetical protein EON62_02510 [archaeon]|nr:MAG: hypothetical protein EON62_02510 [archaeon]